MTYRDEVLADSPDLFFEFEETGGTSVASTVGTYTGTVNGGPQFDQAGPKGGKAIYLDGVDDYLNVALPDFVADGNFSLEVWVKYGSNPLDYPTFFRRNGNGKSIIVRTRGAYNGARIHEIESYHSGESIGSSPTTYNDNGWHHVVYVCNNNYGRLYIDGVEKTGRNGTQSAGAMGTSEDLKIGYGIGVSEYFQGYLSRPAVYGHALTLARIQAHYNAADDVAEQPTITNHVVHSSGYDGIGPWVGRSAASQVAVDGDWFELTATDPLSTTNAEAEHASNGAPWAYNEVRTFGGYFEVLDASGNSVAADINISVRVTGSFGSAVMGGSTQSIPVGGGNVSYNTTFTMTTGGATQSEPIIKALINGEPLMNHTLRFRNVYWGTQGGYVPLGVDAGGSKTITLPDTASLSGFAAGTPTSVEWSKVSGPGLVTFEFAGSLETTAWIDSPGTYVLALSATENSVVTSDSVTITVEATAGSAPVVDAGPDQTITLPDNASLSGVVTASGTPTTTWSATGPGTVTFDNQNVAQTTASFSTHGVYTLTLTADDGTSVGSDSLIVNVNPAENVPPTVDAGENQTITLPATASLEGVVSSDTSSVVWTATGPGTVTFANPNAVSTTASFSSAGTYTLTLTASDGELEALDTVSIVVLADGGSPTVNQPPVVSAGTDKTTTLPNGVSLNAVVTDDGTATVLWSATGPGTVIFADATSVSTTATFSVAGTYILTLTASDGEFSDSDSLTVSVQPEPESGPDPGTNEPPPDLGASPPAGADPTGGFVNGDTWFQRDANNVIIGQWEYHDGYWYTKAVGNQVIANLDAGKITTGYLDASRINVNSITSTKLADGAVTGDKIADGVIASTKITPGAITATALADGAVTTTKIVGGAITTSHIATSGIDAGVITTGSMHGDRITANTISGDKILARSIGSDKIVANAITAYELSTYAITTNHLTANNVIANAVTAANMTAAVITGATIQTGTSTYGNIKFRGAYNDMVCYGPSGQRTFYIDGSTGYVEVNGVIRTSPYGQRIEMGNTGSNDPADEIRMFNGSSTVSMRNYTSSPGHVMFSMQRNNGAYSNIITLYGHSDGHPTIGRGPVGGGARIKFLENNDGVQIRTASDGGYAPIKASAFNVSSEGKFKRKVQPVSISSTAEILKQNGLKKWEWSWDKKVQKFDPKTGEPIGPRVEPEDDENKYGVGLLADNMPDFLKTPDGYSVSATVGFLWEALKEANARIEALENKGNK